MSGTVFISYTWDSPAHKQWVKDLAYRLRATSHIDVILETHEGGFPRFVTAIREEGGVR